MKAFIKVYKVVRSVLFTAILTIIALYVILFVVLNIPPVQDRIREIAQKELSAFLKSDISIGKLSIYPFNEVIVSDVSLMTPAGEKCADIEKLGAGISLMDLIRHGKIVFTYAELLGLNAQIWQQEEGGPLNIDFIIEAVKPKDKNKPPTKFDVVLRNVVIRNCRAKFDRRWIPKREDGAIDFNHAEMTDLRADCTLPAIKNNDFTIDIRRLSFKTPEGLDIEKLSLKTHITDKSISISDFSLRMPGTELAPADMELKFDDFAHIREAFKTADLHLVMVDNKFTPSDLAPLLPQLKGFDQTFTLDVDIEGNMKSIDVRELRVNSRGYMNLDMKGYGSGLESFPRAILDIEQCELYVSSFLVSDIMRLLPGLPVRVRDIAYAAGDVTLSVDGGVSDDGCGKGSLDFSCAAGALSVKADVKNMFSKVVLLRSQLDVPQMDMAKLLGNPHLGPTGLKLIADLKIGNHLLDGTIESVINNITVNGSTLSDVSLNVLKKGNEIRGAVSSADPFASLHAQADVLLDGKNSVYTADAELYEVSLSRFNILKNYPDYLLSGSLSVDIAGNSIDNVIGDVDIDNVLFSNGEKSAVLDNLHLSCAIDSESESRAITLRSDIIDADIEGSFTPSLVPRQVWSMISVSMPRLLGDSPISSVPDMTYNITFKPDAPLFEFVKLPVRPLDNVRISGAFRSDNSSGSIDIDVPYLLKGSKSLIRDTELHATIDGLNESTTVTAVTLFPAKKGQAWLAARLTAHNDRVLSEFGWKGKDTDLYRGKITCDAQINRDEADKDIDLALEIRPTDFYINGTKWHIDNSVVGFIDKVLTVDNIKVWHDDQFVKINGTASASSEDVLNVELADIDLDFIFDTLEINNVSFGGTATGLVEGRSLLSKTPVAATKRLFVRNLSYNGAVLGDGDIRSSWDNDLKKVGIYALITEEKVRRAVVDGGIYIGRDSLSFDFDANKVDIRFLQPFMSAFTSDVRGKASGKAKLYGNFSDIDMTGRLKADTIFMKLDQTNVTYSGSDSVYIDPGRIRIPGFRLYDKFGNSGIFSGTLTHKCFRDPSFQFKLTGARNLLCYDTNEKFNPIWYGTMFCNGNATVSGYPGIVSIDIDMETSPRSIFTFVLSDAQTATDYTFLTFSDRRKAELAVEEKDSVPAAVRRLFENARKTEEGIPTTFALNLQVTATPAARVDLIMDPASGDRISARGAGPVKIGYDSFTDNMTMYGKYTLDEGTYNFTLQDLIIRDFNISPGSTISFNGDPMAAILDISAVYRVNTNLSDLDKSFANDRDLNRTNVPVDAYLLVKGDLDSPEITFDLKLPTLTSDVERKVKSIVSTDDMMSRQILYLLALNRFYTPEYMGVTSNGTGELASVASSTISSQFSRMIGSLTDKVSLAPSFRSDRGDFSDFEMDLALSSRLLNNRLLLNGNFGYRDRKSSSTTFVGDFDIEYLLSRNGNLRLKAYNHFNDGNYYLRSALTTQGIGIVYRHDFNHWFSFLRRKKKRTHQESVDSVVK